MCPNTVRICSLPELTYPHRDSLVNDEAQRWHRLVTQ